VGGHTPSFDYEYILQGIPEIDSIVRFEGEHILLNLAKAILNKEDWRTIKGLAFRDEDKVISNELSPLISNLDEFPFTHRDYLPYLINNHREEYTVHINRGRGCYRKCVFCSIPRFFSIPSGKIFRQRSNENLLSEIENLVTNYQVKDFTFIDDVFISPSKEGKSNTIELAKEIEKRRLNIQFSIAERIDNLDEELIDALISAGLVRIFIGLEAATQKILDQLDKRISRKIIESTMEWLLKKNIDVEISFINFLPFNTLEDIRENVLFFSNLGIDTLRSLGNRLEPYPGTSIHDVLRNKRNLRRTDFSYDYIGNTVDSRIDIFYKIIEPSIPFLALVSYQLRYVKTFLRKIHQFVKAFEKPYNNFISLQKVIVFEVRDILLKLIEYLRKNKDIDIEPIIKELYQTLVQKTEQWLSLLMDLKKNLEKEVYNGAMG
jgi:radical SAM superfamily enzyme YgiQ (UPF0313 family)